MNFKKIALAAAAAAAATPAMAADLPVVAEPVNYVETCSAYGNGYFKLPGQDTCVRVHGRIRTQIESHDLTEGYQGTEKGTAGTAGHKPQNAYSAYARGYLYLESMTATELASIKTYTELQTQWSDSGAQGGVSVNDAYVQFGFDKLSVLLGRTGSSFDDFGGYSEIGVIGIANGGDDSLQVSATADLGNGFTAAFALEDSKKYAGAEKNVDFVGNFALTQGIFTAALSGAAHTIESGEYGFATAGKVEIAATDALKFGFGASYAKDALAYISGDSSHAAIPAAVRKEINAADKDGTAGYVLSTGVEYAVSDTVTLALDGSYADYDFKGAGQLDEIIVNGSVAYKPVAGLTVALDAGWYDIEAKADNGDKGAVDGAKIAGRVQYSF